MVARDGIEPPTPAFSGLPETGTRRNYEGFPGCVRAYGHGQEQLMFLECSCDPQRFLHNESGRIGIFAPHGRL